MNKEVIKAMNKKEVKTGKFCKRWGNKIKEKITLYLHSSKEWDKKKAKEILDYYIPRKSEWLKYDKSFYLVNHDYDWLIDSAKKYLKRRDRRFWSANSNIKDSKIRDYLLDEFELEGFKKKILHRSNDRTEVWFMMDGANNNDIDWDKVPVYTPVLVKNFYYESWKSGMFARFENNQIYVFVDKDQWTFGDKVSTWAHTKIKYPERLN